MNYIDQIKSILSATTWSQQRLAKELRVTFAALNRWLNGHAQPRAAKRLAIHRLHKNTVGLPAVSEEQCARAIKRANQLKRKNLWETIAKRQDLQDDLLLEHTYNSTSIEGTTFNKKETEGVIFQKALIPDKTLIEHLEVTNHAAVLRSLFQKRYAPPLSETLVQTLHRDLMQGIRDDAGRYSTHQRGTRGIDIALTHPADIPEEMGRLIHDWNHKSAKKTVANLARFHADFELIHPFGDGNGRIGRLLMVLQCLDSGFPPVVIENARKDLYYETLEYAQRKSEYPFVVFLAEEMERTERIIQKYLVKKI